MTTGEREACIVALKALEAGAALIPVPGNLLLLELCHLAENVLAQELDAMTVENLRAAVEQRVQERLAVKFGG